MLITGLYKHNTGESIYAVYFDVPDFPINGLDCDTPENQAVLVSGLYNKLLQQAKAYHDALRGDAGPAPTSFPGTRVLAFYTDRRGKALIERFDNPIIL